MRTDLAHALVLASLAWTAQAAPVHYEMSVRIEANELRGHGVITAAPGKSPAIVVSAPFRIDFLQRNEGKVEVRWHGPLQAHPRGLFLPASSGWYPAIPGELASYGVSLELPAAQAGLVPGTLEAEAIEQGRYKARFRFAHPAPGIELMAGPYQVAERYLRSAAGRRIRLRTYFHAEIAGLSSAYLDALGGYLDLYSKWIGEYPFGEFSVVSSPTPTGFGMATLAYLGIDVLKLPFIRATSLGHEVLHNWWGNGVYPDYGRGNWSEGLTTFMADYAYKEREGEAAAREMRLAWLRDLAALPESEDFPLRAFTSRTHSASQIVGYRKAAMLFFVLRETIGAGAFDLALREFWRSKQFRVADWQDLQRAFERASGRNLKAFFSQWLDRRGTPQLRIAEARARAVPGGWRVGVSLAQDGQPYALRVPMLLVTDEVQESRVLDMSAQSVSFEFETAARPRELLLDPDARMLRRLAAGEAPPILRRVAVDPQLRTVIASDSSAGAARALAQALAEHPLRVLGPAEAAPGDPPLLIIGLEAEVDAWLARHRLPARPAALRGKGSAQVWTATREPGGPLAVVSARDAKSLEALTRPLPHYGGHSFVVFDGAKAIERGVWPAQPQAWRFPGSG